MSEVVPAAMEEDTNAENADQSACAVTSNQSDTGGGHVEERVDDSAATAGVSPAAVRDAPTSGGAVRQGDHDDGVQPTQRRNEEAGREWIVRCERTRRYLRQSVRVLPNGSVVPNTASYLLVPLFLDALGYSLDDFERYRGIAWPSGWRVTVALVRIDLLDHGVLSDPPRMDHTGYIDSDVQDSLVNLLRPVRRLPH